MSPSDALREVAKDAFEAGAKFGAEDSYPEYRWFEEFERWFTKKDMGSG